VYGPTYEEVMNSQDSHHWKRAIEKELKTLEENNTWSEVDPSKN